MVNIHMQMELPLGNGESVKNQDKSHNEVRDRIAQQYLTLPRLNCLYCKRETPLPTEGVVRVVTEHRHDQFRADVAALNQQGEIIAIVEVVHTHPPTEQTFIAQSNLETAFYVMQKALDNGFSGYCSQFCWTHRNEKNTSEWHPASCDACERPYCLMDLTYSFVDYEDFYTQYCIECAAAQSPPHVQWRPPDDLIGDPEWKIPGPDADIVDLFLSFADADFWAMVWTDRTATLNQERNPETQTAARLRQIEAAFDRGDWYNGQKLLQVIGAPAWARPDGPALFAWNHDNCVRVAHAWRRLREYRISCLPPSVQAKIQSRPPLNDVVTNDVVTNVEHKVEIDAVPNTETMTITHRGFPDGRFTACGIDKHKTDEPIVTTMKENPTCGSCRSLS